jgi:septum formation protein
MGLILASSSAIRRAMLHAAGVEYQAITSRMDEGAIKARLSGATEIAATLAEAKAVDVSSGRPGEWVAGSDSVVIVEGRMFDKPASFEEAADHLRFFSGKEMKLTSAAALARDGAVDWSHDDTATLHVRPLSDGFIGDYLAAEWPEVGYCVGVFRMEGRGVQLFERMEGNYFTILGMPLLPLLGALRARGLVPA